MTSQDALCAHCGHMRKLHSPGRCNVYPTPCDCKGFTSEDEEGEE